MTKKQNNELGDLVRKTPFEVPATQQSVNWAVQYHLALFWFGLEKAEQVIENLTLACNTMREDNIVTRLGFEAIEKLKGNPFADINYRGYQVSTLDESPTPSAEPA